MADNYEIPELSEDEFADDDIVTLLSADGEEIDFVEIAGIAHKGNFYAILQPVELIEGMSEDEALVFLVTRDDGKRTSGHGGLTGREGCQGGDVQAPQLLWAPRCPDL